MKIYARQINPQYQDSRIFDDDGNMEDISGMTFSQLPEWVQDRINEYSLTIYYYEDMTEQEIR